MDFSFKNYITKRRIVYIFAFVMICLLIGFQINQPIVLSRVVSVEKTTEGYNLAIVHDRWYAVTPDGSFFKKRNTDRVQLIGEGSDLSYRAQEGMLYSYDQIKVNNFPHADIGYAWINKENSNLYLNLYWVNSPDGIKPSDVNGKYSLSPKS